MNIYLCALAISDIIIILAAFLLFLIENLRYKSLLISNIFAILTPLTFPLGLTAQSSSVFLTVLSAIDCFIRIYSNRNCKRRFCNTSTAIKVVGMSSILAIFYNSPHIFEINIVNCWNIGYAEESIDVCPTDLRQNELYLTVYYAWMYTVIMAIGPVLILIILNSAIIIALRNTLSVSGDSDIITLVVVVCLFITCNILPLTVNLLELISAMMLYFWVIAAVASIASAGCGIKRPYTRRPCRVLTIQASPLSMEESQQLESPRQVRRPEPQPEPRQPSIIHPPPLEHTKCPRPPPCPSPPPPPPCPVRSCPTPPPPVPCPSCPTLPPPVVCPSPPPCPPPPPPPSCPTPPPPKPCPPPPPPPPPPTCPPLSCPAPPLHLLPCPPPPPPKPCPPPPPQVSCPPRIPCTTPPPPPPCPPIPPSTLPSVTISPKTSPLPSKSLALRDHCKEQFNSITRKVRKWYERQFGNLATRTTVHQDP
ncbi:BMA-FRPR-1 [Dirofilaria immitis]|nr:BMA-FRPR-1 [Dirofilaria immitis]